MYTLINEYTTYNKEIKDLVLNTKIPLTHSKDIFNNDWNDKTEIEHYRKNIYQYEDIR